MSKSIYNSWLRCWCGWLKASKLTRDQYDTLPPYSKKCKICKGHLDFISRDEYTKEYKGSIKKVNNTVVSSKGNNGHTS